MNRMPHCEALGLTVAAAFTLAALVPTVAASPAYVGTWAEKPSTCRNGQDVMDAPLIMKDNGYDQHETHCKFSSVRPYGGHGGGWRVKAKCQVEGDTQASNLTLNVKRDRLTIRDEAAPRTLQRCR